jgi:methylated-DNA-[protein]-cysteine S-methyltransferase
MDIAAFILKTDLGWIGVSGTEKGLRQFILPQSSFSEVCLLLGIELKPEAEIPTVLTDIIERLKLYLKGYQTAFPDRLDLSKGTEFQRRVWEITRLIPYGETRSYSWVAEKIGNRNAVRAVGQALRANPLPLIVPCHRVLTKEGAMGGYSGGIDMKRYLLWLEASAFMRDRTS